MTLLSMLFKGIPGDERVHQSDFDGSGWSPPLVIPQIVSGSHPVWTRYYDQTLFVAWRDVAAPHAVHAARYDGPNDWAWLGAVPGATTGTAPAAAAMSWLPGRVLLAWRADGNTGIHVATFDSLHWSAATAVPGAASSHAPAVACFESKIHLAWKGIAGDHNVYHATYGGSSWSSLQQLPGILTTSQPALTTYASGLAMAWKGQEGDPAIYWATLGAGGATWSPVARIGDFETGTGPSILEFGDRLHLVWK
ncbi:MAG TPA: hypothetical protein VK607_03600, partial [Kofleriaceae bacterium]|nr:hypothetical protein [Kofleriaceae bacterium]